MSVADLRNFEFFADFGPADLAKVAETGRQVRYPADLRLFHEGAVANGCWFIETGQVDVDSPQEGPHPMVLQSLGAGEVLGWSWLLPPYRWHFGAVTVTPVTAFLLDTEALRDALEAEPRLGYLFTQQVSNVLLRRLQSTRARTLEYHRRLKASQTSLGR